MEEGLDSVSNIHKRWSFTRINFSSYKISLIISIISSLLIIILTEIYFLQDSVHIIIYSILGLIFLICSYILDFYLLRDTPVNKFSKILHVSAFSNLIWMAILILGIVSYMTFNKDNIPIGHIIEGMMVAIGLRVGIFTSVFGAGLKKAIKTAIYQPFLLLFVITPLNSFKELTDPLPIAFGLIILGLGIAWVILVDRSGRPYIKSTFSLLQAFMSAWTENKVENIEKILISKSREASISTRIVRFGDDFENINLVLPDIHPGPFKTIGGSNLSFRIWEYYHYKSIVFHSVSDHSLNIPSSEEVIKYLDSLSTYNIIQNGTTCSIPITVTNGSSTCTGIAFGNIPLIILSNSPVGMDDVPENLLTELEKYSKEIGFDKILIIDSHNAMGKKLEETSRNDMLNAAKSCLRTLKNSPQSEFKISYSSIRDIQSDINNKDLGKAGISIFMIQIHDKQYFLGWIDSNNMKNGLREHIIKDLEKKDITLLDICTSDTHENSGFRTSEGYFPFGEITSFDQATKYFIEILSEAQGKIKNAKYEILDSKTSIKVMGNGQFEDYSRALDKSMNLTKIFLAITFGIIVLMLIVTK